MKLTLLLELCKDSAPADFHSYLHVGSEVVAVVNSGDDLILVEYRLKLRVRVVRIPFLCLWSQALKEQKSLGRESIKGIDINRVLLEDGAVVESPCFVTVD